MGKKVKKIFIKIFGKIPLFMGVCKSPLCCGVFSKRGPLNWGRVQMSKQNFWKNFTIFVKWKR